MSLKWAAAVRVFFFLFSEGPVETLIPITQNIILTIIS